MHTILITFILLLLLLIINSYIYIYICIYTLKELLPEGADPKLRAKAGLLYVLLYIQYIIEAI